MKTKSAFIAIVGCPNVGKSSILNRLMGAKIAIVSPKPQTTRTRIMGVLTEGDIQLVFTDTPGYHKPHNKLDEKMGKAISEGIHSMDACMLVVEPDEKIQPAEEELIKRFKREDIPALLVINKIDTVAEKEKLMKVIFDYSKLYDFEAIIPVSALDGNGMDALKEELKKLSFESEHLFPDDTLTDQPEKVIAAEYIREKLLRSLDKEIPHGTAVSIESFKERDDGSNIIDIDAVIFCERDSHKGIIIGKQGAMLKKISTRARIDMERFFDCKINLHCWVKVKEDWRNREALIHNFGLD